MPIFPSCYDVVKYLKFKYFSKYDDLEIDVDIYPTTDPGIYYVISEGHEVVGDVFMEVSVSASFYKNKTKEELMKAIAKRSYRCFKKTIVRKKREMKYD